MTRRCAPSPASLPLPVGRAALFRGLAAAGLLGAGVLVAGAPAGAQTAVTPAEPPAASGTTATPPDIVKPRTAGPGDSTAGVIHPGPTGDAEMHVSPPAGKSFPTPVIRPQTMQGGGTPVVPK